jgi:hypothetical protein
MLITESMMYMCANGTYSTCQHNRHHKYWRKRAGLQLSTEGGIRAQEIPKISRRNKHPQLKEVTVQWRGTNFYNPNHKRQWSLPRRPEPRLPCVSGAQSVSGTWKTRSVLIRAIVSHPIDRRETFNSYNCTLQSLRWESLQSMRIMQFSCNTFHAR